MQLILGLQVGGLETMVIRLVKALDRKRFEPMVCCIDELGPLADELRKTGIDVHLLQRRPGVDWRYPRRLAKLLKQQRVDVLHLHNPTALFYGSIAGRLAGIHPVIYTEHGRDYATGRKAQLINRLVTRLVDQVVVLHERARCYMQKKEGVPPARLVKIHNGIPALSPTGDNVRERTRRSLELADNARVIAMVARLDPIKNLPILLTAMAEIKGQQPTAHLLIVGDGPLRESLERQTLGLGLQAVVHFLGTRHDVPDLLAASDVLVLPSLSEGLSMTLIEGSAAGLPLVASDVGGNNELVEHGVNGLLVPVSDAKALAGALIAIIMDQTKAEHMGKASRQRFHQYFEIGAMVARYQALYESGISEYPLPG